MEDDENLARYIFSSKHIRADRTVKHLAFLPREGEGLSVVRHDDLRDSDLWGIGRAMERVRADTLHGRSDVTARTFTAHKLWVAPAPTSLTPCHAEVQGWPPDRSQRMLVATEIAASASKAVEPPPEQ